MDSIVKEKETPFSHSCPQRSLLRHHRSLCISNLLDSPYQNPNSSTVSSGLFRLSIFSSSFSSLKFDWALFLGWFCSLMTHCSCASRWDSRWLLTTRVAVSGSQLLMPTTALVFEFFYISVQLSIGSFQLNFDFWVMGVGFMLLLRLL